jgi:hypothetical protein
MGVNIVSMAGELLIRYVELLFLCLLFGAGRFFIFLLEVFFFF